MLKQCEASVVCLQLREDGTPEYHAVGIRLGVVVCLHGDLLSADSLISVAPRQIICVCKLTHVASDQSQTGAKFIKKALVHSSILLYIIA